MVASAVAGVLAWTAGCSTTTAGEAARKELRENNSRMSADLAAQQAQQAFSVGNLDDALENAEYAMTRMPTEPKHYIMRARILIECHRLQDALATLDEATRIDPENAEAHYYAGVVFQRWSNDEEASNRYAEAYRIEPTDPDFVMAHLETLISLRRFDEANELLAMISPTFEYNASVHRARGHLAMMEGNPVLAAEHFHRSMLLAPEDHSVTEDLAIALYESGQYASAQQYIKQLLAKPECKDRRDLKHMQARCMVANDELVDARYVYLDLVDENPSDATIWFEFGMLAYRIGDDRKLGELAFRGVKMWPSRHEGYVLRGLIYEQQNRLEEASRDFRKAADLADDPRNPLLLLGMTYRQMGRDTEANAVFAEALAQNPNDREIEALMAGADEAAFGERGR
jgi:Flp pilus assembly protein TadD